MNPIQEQQIKVGVLPKSLKDIVLEAANVAGMGLGALDDLSRSLDSIAVGIGIQSKDLRVHVISLSDAQNKVTGYEYTLIGRNLDKGVGFTPLRELKEENHFGADPNLHLDSARNYWAHRLEEPDAQSVLNRPNSPTSTTVAPA